MWLINNHTKKLEFIQNPKKGSYAILSHTWGDDEISFQKFQQYEDGMPGQQATKTQGLQKILKTCELARERNLGHSWVDTCCIDKLSSAELSEAINSMFRWYRNAAVCFVYLSDLAPGAFFECDLAACRWLKRGWTLQELIAPRHVEFYDRAWNKTSSKAESLDLLFFCTGIEQGVLEDAASLPQIPVARRMSWASMRKTTRVEDMAYCLMGIFDIHMPMIYGEGAKAFFRLQEEIAKQSCDLSLFAWISDVPFDRDEDDHDDDDRARAKGQKEEYRGLFARSPREFFRSGNLHHVATGGLIERGFTITNRGIRMRTSLINAAVAEGDSVLNLNIATAPRTDRANHGMWMGVILAKTPLGYVRRRPDLLCRVKVDLSHTHERKEISIRKDVSSSEKAVLADRFLHSIYYQSVPRGWRLLNVRPTPLWDDARCLFLHQAGGISATMRWQAISCGSQKFHVVVVCSTFGEPRCQVWTEHDEAYNKIVYNHLRRKTELLGDYAVNESASQSYDRPLATFQCNCRKHLVRVTARLMPGEYEGSKAYFLDFSSSREDLD